MNFLISTIPVLATLAINLLAGLNLGSAIARLGTSVLPAETWIGAHQAEDAIFRRVMPPFILSTIALSLLAAVASSRGARLLFALSALLVVFDMALTIARLLPLNRAIETWKPGAPPAEWKQVRGDWLRLHTMRTLALAIAGLLSTTALVLP